MTNSSNDPGSISKAQPYFPPSPSASTPIVKHDYGPCQSLGPLRRSKAGRPRGRKDIQGRRPRGFWEGVPAFEQLRLRRVRRPKRRCIKFDNGILRHHISNRLNITTGSLHMSLARSVNSVVPRLATASGMAYPQKGRID